MLEPLVKCPNCSHEFKLTETLAAPVIEETRKRFSQQMAAKDAEISRKAEELRRQEEELSKRNANLNDQIEERLREELKAVSTAEAAKAREAVAFELDTRTKEVADLRGALAINNEKLNEAQKVQADLLRKQRELDDAKRELDLTVEKRVFESVEAVRTKARQDAENDLLLKVTEKDQQISAMARTIEDLKRKAEQASQQAQGEALEVELEELLRSRFPLDIVEPVAKGELGADLIQRVNASLGQPAGIILWESKRTKSWSEAWLSKLRDDQRRCSADAALIVSQALPKFVESFDLIDGVWVAHPRYAIPVAVALRHSLVEVASTRIAQQGQQSKMEQVYQYLTGTRFRQRVEAIVEKYSDMQDDLDKERKYLIRQWAKRETQIQAVIESTVGMVGDLQGIAGKAIPEIGPMELPLIMSPDDSQK